MRGRGAYGRQESGTDTLKEPEMRGRGYKQDTGQPGASTWQGGLVTSIEEAEKLLTWAGQRKKWGTAMWESDGKDPHNKRVGLFAADPKAAVR